MLVFALLLTFLPGKVSAADIGSFTDVQSSDWYGKEVAFVYENGLMNGTSTTTFSPNQTTSRGMIVTILHRMENEPAATQEAQFSDVAADAYYANAVAWASENDIVNGYPDGTFRPNDPITRQQLATILYRYVAYKNALSETSEDLLAAFPDASAVSDFAVAAMNWAVGVQLIQGTDAGLLNPQGSATRAQVAVILYRFYAKNLGTPSGTGDSTDDEKTTTSGGNRFHGGVHAGGGNSGGNSGDNSGGNSGDNSGDQTTTYTVTIQAADAGNQGLGTVDVSSLTSVPSGATLTISGNTLTYGETTVTASVASGVSHAEFVNWTIDGTATTGTVTVSGNMTIVANFKYTDVTFAYYNGTDADPVVTDTIARNADGTSKAETLKTIADVLGTNATKDYQTAVAWTYENADGTITTPTTFDVDANTPDTVKFTAKWATDDLRAAINSSVAAVQEETSGIEEQLTTVATNADLNSKMEKLGDWAKKLASKLATKTDKISEEQVSEIVDRITRINWNKVDLADDWVKINENDDHAIDVDVSGKAAFQLAAGVSYAALQNVDEYTMDSLLASIIEQTEDLVSTLLPDIKSEAENYRGVTETFTLSYKGDGDTALYSVEFTEVDDLYKELRAALDELSESGKKTVAKEIVNILKDHIAATDAQNENQGVKALVGMALSVANDMLDQASEGTIALSFVVDFTVKDTNENAAYYEAEEGSSAIFSDSYTLNLTGKFDDANHDVYKLLNKVQTELESLITKVGLDTDIIYSSGNIEDLFSALVDNIDKLEDGVDLYVTIPVTTEMQNAYNKAIQSLINSTVKDTLQNQVEGLLGTTAESADTAAIEPYGESTEAKTGLSATIANAISDQITSAGLTTRINDNLNTELTKLDGDKVNITLTDIGFDADDLADAITADIQTWWTANGSQFIDDVLTGEDVYDSDKAEIKSTALSKLEDYLGEGSKTRDYLNGLYYTEGETDNLKTVVEQALQNAITKTVKAKVEELNTQIANIDSQLASVETTIADANKTIETVNSKIGEINQYLTENKSDLGEVANFDPNTPVPTINSLTLPDDFSSWTIAAIVVPDEWTWTTTTEKVKELADKLTELSTLLGNISDVNDADGKTSLAEMVNALTSEIEAAQTRIDEVKAAAGNSLEAYTIPEIKTPNLNVADAQEKIESANTALAKFENDAGEIDIDAKIEAALETVKTAFEDATTGDTSAIRPHSLALEIASAMQKQLNSNAKYQSLKALLPLTDENGEGSLDLATISINNVDTLLTAAGVDLNSFDANGTVASTLNKAGSALAKLAQGVSATAEIDTETISCSVSLSDLATALQGADLNTIYQNLLTLLGDAKKLTLSDFTETPITIMVANYPVTVYLTVDIK
jgi:hypothetical protein